MELTEKIAYIKGYAEGLDLDETKDEVKVLNKILEFLDDMAQEVQELGELYDEAADMIEEIDEELFELEDALIESDDDKCGCGCDDCDDDENPVYEVTCPECDKKIYVEEDELMKGEIDCPECGSTLEFDFDGLFDEDGHGESCDCGCEHDEHYGEDDLMS